MKSPQEGVRIGVIRPNWTRPPGWARNQAGWARNQAGWARNQESDCEIAANGVIYGQIVVDSGILNPPATGVQLRNS